MGIQTYLSSKAVSHRANLCNTVFLLQRLDTIDHNRVNGILGVRVVATGAVGQPIHKIKIFGSLP
jgi:hypothetical protein